MMEVFKLFDHIFTDSVSKDVVGIIIVFSVVAIITIFFTTRSVNRNAKTIESASENATKQVKASTSAATDTLETLVKLTEVMQTPILKSISDLTENLGVTNKNVGVLIEHHEKQYVLTQESLKLTEASLKLNQQYLEEIQKLNAMLLDAIHKDGQKTRDSLAKELVPITTAINVLNTRIESLPAAIRDSLKPSLDEITDKIKVIEKNEN